MAQIGEDKLTASGRQLTVHRFVVGNFRGAHVLAALDDAAARGVLGRILAGEPIGTWLPATAGRKRARKAGYGG